MARLHERFPDLAASLPHRPLGHVPTAVRPLPALSDHVDVWLKEEGDFGDGAWGGNKVRKLEWLIPDLQRRGRRTVLTVGGIGTNWGLACARYGAEAGLRTVLALVDQPVDAHVRAQLTRLEHSGATIHRTRTVTRTVAAMPWLMLRHHDGLRPPAFLPAGGSSPVGALGYVEVALEIADQVRTGELPEPTAVVVPVGSGGTVAGLLLGMAVAGLSTRVVGVVVNDSLRLDEATLLRLARRTARLLRDRGAWDVPDPDPGALLVTDRWLGPGYGHPTAEARLAHDRAVAEGLDLDPVYTAKACAGLLGLAAEGALGSGPVLFVHTDGPR